MVSPAPASALPSDAASGKASSRIGRRSSLTTSGGLSSLTVWRRRGARSRRSAGSAASPVVGELEGHVEIEVAQLLDHRLELVLVLARDPQLVTLRADLRLRMLAADPLGEVSGELLADSLAQLDHLPHVAFGCRLRLLRVEHLEIDPTPMRLALQDIDDRL